MSLLLNISESLQDLGAEIVRAEQSLSRYPFNRSVQLTLQSLVRRRDELEDEFASAANGSGVEVCRYGLSGSGIGTASNVFLALAEFQKLLTAGYATVKHGKRSKLRFSDEDVKATSLGFSYSLAGSVIAIFTIPNDRLLFDDDQTYLEQSVSLIFEMAQASTAELLRERSHRYGAALVHALYDWSELHARFDLYADIAWKRAKVVRNSLRMQPSQFASLNGLIRKSGSEISRSDEFTGTLMAVSLIKKTFTFKPDNGENISGTFFDAITDEEGVEVSRRRYKAVIAEHSSIILATDEEKLSHFLESLTPLNDAVKGEPWVTNI